MLRIQILTYVLSLVLFLTCACTQEKDLNQKQFSHIQVRRGDLVGKLSWRGIVRAINRLELRSNRRAKLSRILVKNDAVVKKGQTLIEVDRTELENKRVELTQRTKTLKLELNSLKLKQEFARKGLERKKILLDKGIAALKEFEETKREFNVSVTSVESKKLELEKAERELTENGKQMDATNFVAPVGGIISEVFNPQHESLPEIQAGQLLAIISDPSKLALWISVEEGNVHLLKRGMPAQITLDALNGESISGTIASINTTALAADPNAGVPKQKLYEVAIEFAAPTAQVREGYSGEGVVIYNERKNALIIPIAAMRHNEGRDLVIAAKSPSDVGSPKYVTLGLQTENEVEISAGLSENEYVVIDPN